MKIISWNVNGIRAALKKGFSDYVRAENPDILCLQETKASQGQAIIDLPEYREHWNSAIRKGYSGTAIFTKQTPISVYNDLLVDGKRLVTADKYGDANTEGRVITAEYQDFFLVNVYTPNAKQDLSRVELRHKQWDTAFLEHLKNLESIKPVIFCGDLNVAHEEIDLARPKTNHNTHGFTAQEREGFSNLVSAGFLDSFRSLHPDESNHYTWWSAFGGARARNVGWRIDYFGISQTLKPKLKEAFIRPGIMGSDHCPVGIIMKI